MSFSPLNGPLAGQAVFLSASVPSADRAKRYRRIPQAFTRIEEAALRVAGAVFNAGGTLVFGGHPSISPLIGYLCEQYQPHGEAEGQKRRSGNTEAAAGHPRVIMFQSEMYRESWEAPSEGLAKLAGVEVIWTEAVGGERYNDANDHNSAETFNLFAMRHQMLMQSQPVAMVVIGGMQGVEDEFNFFSAMQQIFPIYTIPSTGGAAKLITDKYPRLVRSFDNEVRENVCEFRRQMRSTQLQGGSARNSADEEEEEILIPYANVASRIVQDIIQHIERLQR